MNYLKFTHDKLDLDQLYNLALSPIYEHEVSLYASRRDNNNRQEELHLNYEAYESMALGILEVICKETREKWPEIENIVIYYRLGSVPVRENNIVIAISSYDRKAADDATAWCFAYVRSRVPVWKTQVDDVDNKPEVQRNHESYPPKRKTFTLKQKRRVMIPDRPRPYQIQIKVKSEELYWSNKVEELIQQRRAEIDRNNIQEFINPNRNPAESCARIDSQVKRRPNSNSHLPVSVVLNAFHRDQFNTDYLLKYIPPNPTEERLQNLESTLNVRPPVNSTYDERFNVIERRVKSLESIPPEYLMFYEKSGLLRKAKTKKIYSIPEIDLMIENLEEQLRRKKEQQCNKN